VSEDEAKGKTQNKSKGVRGYMQKYGLTQKGGIIRDKIWGEKIGAKKPRPTKWRNIRYKLYGDGDMVTRVNN
jgi:hypothetical protein